MNRCLTADLAKIGPGQAQYTLLCAEDGGVVDDLIVYLRAEDDLLLVPNAANCADRGRDPGRRGARAGSRWSTGTPTSR